MKNFIWFIVLLIAFYAGFSLNAFMFRHPNVNGVAVYRYFIEAMTWQNVDIE